MKMIWKVLKPDMDHLSGLTWVINLGFSFCVCITESQNGRGWKGPLGQGPPRACCTGAHPGGF